MHTRTVSWDWHLLLPKSISIVTTINLLSNPISQQSTPNDAVHPLKPEKIPLPKSRRKKSFHFTWFIVPHQYSCARLIPWQTVFGGLALFSSNAHKEQREHTNSKIEGGGGGKLAYLGQLGRSSDCSWLSATSRYFCIITEPCATCAKAISARQTRQSAPFRTCSLAVIIVNSQFLSVLLCFSLVSVTSDFKSHYFEFGPITHTHCLFALVWWLFKYCVSYSNTCPNTIAVEQRMASAIVKV